MIGGLFSGSVWPWLIVQATSCIAAGLAASYLLRRSAARAHQVLLTALAAAVLAPAAFILVGHLQLGVLPSKPRAPQIAEPDLSFDAPTVDVPAMEAAYEAPAATIPAPLPWRTICLAGWIGLTAILLGRLILRLILGLRLLRMAHPVTGEPLQRALEAAKVRLGIDGPIRIRCSEKIKSPIIWCWTGRPVLLVHRQATGHQDNADWVSVFCHELAHLRRRDHASGLFGEILTALFPWHPLLWWAAARLSKLSEQACDDWVLAGGQSGVDYAETLLGFAAQRQMAFIPTVIGKDKTMSTRIQRIIRDRGGDPRIGARWTAGVGIVAVLAVVSVGFAQRRPAERPEPAPEAVAARSEARQRGDEAPVWQREILLRKLDQLTGQIRDKEALLRESWDGPPEERRNREFELDLLRDMTAQIERRLQNLEGPESRRPRSADRSLQSGERQRTTQTRAQTRAREQVQRAEEREARRNDLAKALDNLNRQRGEIERRLESLDNQQTDEAHDLKAKLDQTVRRMGEVEEQFQQLRRLERESAGPQTAPPETMRGRGAPENRNGDMYASERAAGRPPGNYVTRVYRLAHADPEQVRTIIQTLLGESGRITIDGRTGSVVVTATPDNHARIERVLVELDTAKDNRDLRNEVEDLRNQMNGLREQLEQMHKLLEQTANRDRPDREERRQGEVQESSPN